MQAIKCVQAGVMAFRAPNGEFLPSIPVYIKTEDAGRVNEQTGQTAAGELLDVGKMFADKHRQYIEGVKAAESARRKRKPRKAETAI